MERRSRKTLIIIIVVVVVVDDVVVVVCCFVFVFVFCLFVFCFVSSTQFNKSVLSPEENSFVRKNYQIKHMDVDP